MSVQDLIGRARTADLVHLDGQEELTREAVLPEVPGLLEEIARARKAMDARFLGAAGGKAVSAAHGDMELARYPIGFCREICNEVSQQLCLSPRVQQLVSKGVVFRTVYIMLYGRYFQNAIQLGNLYFDAANDTVDINKPFLEWMPIRQLDYENLESWEQVIPVVESYFHCRVVPNHVFPLLAPLVPLLGIRSNGRIDLMLFQDTFFLKDLGEGMRRYVEWIRGGQGVAARRLSRADLSMLEHEFGGNDFDRFPFEFAPAEVEELVAQAGELVEISRRKEGQEILMKLTELGHQAVRLFRQRNLVSSRA